MKNRWLTYVNINIWMMFQPIFTPRFFSDGQTGHQSWSCRVEKVFLFYRGNRCLFFSGSKDLTFLKASLFCRSVTQSAKESQVGSMFPGATLQLATNSASALQMAGISHGSAHLQLVNCFPKLWVITWWIEKDRKGICEK